MAERFRKKRRLLTSALDAEDEDEGFACGGEGEYDDCLDDDSDPFAEATPPTRPAAPQAQPPPSRQRGGAKKPASAARREGEAYHLATSGYDPLQVKESSHAFRNWSSVFVRRDGPPAAKRRGGGGGGGGGGSSLVVSAPDGFVPRRPAEFLSAASVADDVLSKLSKRKQAAAEAERAARVAKRASRRSRFAEGDAFAQAQQQQGAPAAAMMPPPPPPPPLPPQLRGAPAA
eukprot:Rhum_TRINITY_DN14733_c8_g1::Rhum_TRINITY_DN14733_c8_g1_i1::g.113052::m.113052